MVFPMGGRVLPGIKVDRGVLLLGKLPDDR